MPTIPATYEAVGKGTLCPCGNRSEFETKLSTLRKEQAETQRKITALIDSLADLETAPPQST